MGRVRSLFGTLGDIAYASYIAEYGRFPVRIPTNVQRYGENGSIGGERVWHEKSMKGMSAPSLDRWHASVVRVIRRGYHPGRRGG